jgi:hypothetical protein
MVKLVQTWLRRRLLWIQFQELRREGFAAAWTRSRTEKKILQTPPIQTDTHGPIEVRVLTWRRDYVSMIWALKSFYHYSQVKYPLYIHDGGLLPWQFDVLQAHFPNAKILPGSTTSDKVLQELTRRGMKRSIEYRLKNVAMLKIYDFVIESNADYFVTIDSDIIFFKKPDLLLLPESGLNVNRYNFDDGYWYSVSLEELDRAFGIRPPVGINSGLAIIRRESLDLGKIEEFLAYPPLFNNHWVTEQTLQALCSTLHGVELLPDSYRIGGPPGIDTSLVCKHYPGTHRPLLYSEGMRHLIQTGFLEAVGR